jgi:hypothetical protein
MRPLLFTLAFLTASCAPIKHVTAALKEPTPVPVMEIVLTALSEKGSLCYITKLGSEVRSDGTVPCPPQAEVENIQADVGRANKIHSMQWEKLVLFYTGNVIDCSGIGAMGCTQPFPENKAAMSVVSLYFPWRRSTLRHELTHVAYFWTDAPESKHFCLDNPSMCDDTGAVKLKFLGE